MHKCRLCRKQRFPSQFLKANGEESDTCYSCRNYDATNHPGPWSPWDITHVQDEEEDES